VESRLILGIDNSIDFLNIALSLENSLVEERCVKSTLPPSQIISGHVGQILKGHGYAVDDLSLLTVTLGPGSFTGMRVAIAFAKGLSAGRAIPLIGVSTLDVLAASFSFMEGHYAFPLIDAKKGEVFGALYRVSGGDMKRLSDYGAIKPKDVAGIIRTPCICFGTGIRICEEFISKIEGVTIIRDTFAAVSAWRLILEAIKRADTRPAMDLQPIYGRRSEAEINFSVTVT
jgi:tRNA threonylcarbamoyladenosine biosynthesis protein TsaB